MPSTLRIIFPVALQSRVVNSSSCVKPETTAASIMHSSSARSVKRSVAKGSGGADLDTRVCRHTLPGCSNMNDWSPSYATILDVVPLSQLVLFESVRASVVKSNDSFLLFLNKSLKFFGSLYRYILSSKLTPQGTSRLFA